MKSIKKKMMIKSSLEFCWKLLAAMVLTFVVHEFIYHRLGIGLVKYHMITCYVFNYLLTCLFFVVMLVFKKRNSSQLGFIFLYTSGMKFIFFFVFIQPMLRINSTGKGFVFLAFFIPYAVSLAFEVISMARILKKSE